MIWFWPVHGLWSDVTCGFTCNAFGIGLAFSCSLKALHMDTPLEDLFGSYEWEKWEEAGLEQVMVYLRNSSQVEVPNAFKRLIPKSCSACDDLYK